MENCSCEIGGNIRGAIERYVANRIPPGSFLMATLSNNLKESLIYADEDNRANLFGIVAHLYNCIPGIAWGSPAKVEAWLCGEEE